MFCPGCGAGLADRTKFCPECGAALLVTCSACGDKNPSTARFCSSCGSQLDAASRPSKDVAATRITARPVVAPSAERRHLTVMLCDLVDFTGLSGRLDPEDLREVIRIYHEHCRRVVSRFEGHVANYMGDGVLVYFGYPQAHEDDPERAVRAGLGIAEALRTLHLPAETSLQIHAGIATGSVIVGEMTGIRPAPEQTVVGETPNLAARLQALAGPGMLVLDAATARLVSGLFDLADLGYQELKGHSTPVQAWRVTGERAAESRFEARHRTGIAPLVGRDDEVVGCCAVGSACNPATVRWFCSAASRGSASHASSKHFSNGRTASHTSA